MRAFLIVAYRRCIAHAEPLGILLKSMCGAEPMSIREAARRVGRDVKAVHGDVIALVEAGVIHRNDSGTVEFPFDAVKVEFMLEAA